MAKILNFPVREAHGNGMERYLMARECLALGVIDPFGGWVQILDTWFAEHPEASTRRNDTLRSLLADTWLVFHIACDKAGQLEMTPAPQPALGAASVSRTQRLRAAGDRQ